MGWEMRRGKRVYYRKERYRDEQGHSRVGSIYCGSGERGEAAAREDEERRRAASLAEHAAAVEAQHTRRVNARAMVEAFARALECPAGPPGGPAPPPAFAPRRRYRRSAGDLDPLLYQIVPPRRRPSPERPSRYRP